MKRFPRSIGLEMTGHQSSKSEKIYMEKMDFTSLKDYNLNFLINFGHAATQFLGDVPTWVCLTAKTVQKIQIMGHPVVWAAFEIERLCSLCNPSNLFSFYFHPTVGRPR